MNFLMWWEDFDGKVHAPAILKPWPLWTGKQVFNLIIPKQINLTTFYVWHSESESQYITSVDIAVRIEMGELLSGTLCKKTLRTSMGSLIHNMKWNSSFIFYFYFLHWNGFLLCAKLYWNNIVENHPLCLKIKSYWSRFYS